jgi:hypothetical protein
VIYTTVLTDQELELADEVTDVTIQQNRLLAAVSLIEALGGGWRASDLPTAGDLRSLKYYVNTPPTPIPSLPPPTGGQGAPAGDGPPAGGRGEASPTGGTAAPAGTGGGQPAAGGGAGAP